jgi:hypothetical protein
MSRSILVISFSDLGRDCRVRRQIQQLVKADYKVIAAGEVDPRMAGVDFRLIGPRWNGVKQKASSALNLLSRRYERVYWRMAQVKSLCSLLKGEGFDGIIVNDLEPLPAALRYKKQAKVILDAHEYAPREFEGSLRWRLLWKRYKTYLCRRYLGEVDGMMTVAPGLADEYRRQFGVEPQVVLNAPRYFELAPTSVEEGRFRLVHLGGALRERKIEQLIEIVQRLDDRFTLDLYLMEVGGDSAYLRSLQRLANRSSQVRILDPLPPDRLVEVLNKYDVGIYLLPPASFNAFHALPNKFFDFIQARLAVVVGPSPSMAQLVRDYGCGVVSGDFSRKSFVRALGELTVDVVMGYKICSNQAASLLNYDVEGAKLIEQVDRLLR